MSDFIGPTVSVRPSGVDESVWHCQGCNCGGAIKLTTEWAIRYRRDGRVWSRTDDRGLAVEILKQLKRERRRGLELVHRQVSEWEVDTDGHA